MFKNKVSLRLRLAATLLLLSAFISGSLAWLVIELSEGLEHTLLTTIVNQEADFIDELLSKNPDSRLTQSATLLAWAEHENHLNPPPHIQKMPLGIFHDVNIGGRPYHILRRPSEHGTLTVAMEINAVEDREHQLQISMVIAALLAPILTSIIAWKLGGLTLRPLRRLTNTIRHHTTNKAPEQVAPRFTQPELQPLAEAFDRYEEASQQRLERERRFAAAASHELRTPLSVIKTSLELEAQKQPLSPPLQRSQTTVDKMTQLLDGLLALNQTANSADSINASTTIQASIENYQAAFAQKNWQLQTCISEDIALELLPAHLEVILNNLLTNALNHMQPNAGQNGEVRVTLSQQQLAVEDNGKAPAAGYNNDLFNYGAKSRHSLGAGLGMYIVAQIVQLYGWHIRAQNSPQGGLGVYINFSAIR